MKMLLMVEKRFRGGICHYIYWYAKANNKYLKDDDKNKESPYLQYWDIMSMSQKHSVNNFGWIKVKFQFNGGFIKNYNEENDEGYFLEVDC